MSTDGIPELSFLLCDTRAEPPEEREISNEQALRYRPALPGEKNNLRPEIQALRAFAVGLVLIYHLWPSRLPGGFIGVDVFFLISGYLITGHIVRPLQRGTFSLAGFYGRRIVRLLPAALTVLLAVLIATLAFVPKNLWPEFGQQLVSSALYFENWILAANAVDYSAPAADVSAVQHFWSLAAEEQFYLAWPVLLLAASVLARRLGGARRWYVTVLMVVAVGSFGFSIYETSTNQAAAYFITPTRAWEFALGGLLWLLAPSRVPRLLGIALSWLGLVLVVASALMLSSGDPFPGWIALWPLVGAALVIACGVPSGVLSPAHLYKLRPVQFIGDISYSLYLWHWPLIVILPFVTGSALTSVQRVGILGGSVVLAYCSRRFIELKFIRMGERVRGRGRRRSAVIFAAAAAGMLIIAVPSATTSSYAQGLKQTAWEALQAKLASDPECFGAAALVPAASCGDTLGDATYPAPVIAEDDDFGRMNDGCQAVDADAAMPECKFGDVDSSYRVAVVGDSHAAQWVPAVAAIGSDQGWAVSTFVRSSCPLTSILPTYASGNPACEKWVTKVKQQLVSGGYNVVILSALSEASFPTTGSLTSFENGKKGFEETLMELNNAGIKVIVIRDNPDPPAGGVADTPTCVASARDLSACGTSQASSLLPDALASASRDSGIGSVVDLTDYFCKNGTCPATVGGVLVYHERQHITVTYAQTLAPMLHAALTKVSIGGTSP